MARKPKYNVGDCFYTTDESIIYIYLIKEIMKDGGSNYIYVCDKLTMFRDCEYISLTTSYVSERILKRSAPYNRMVFETICGVIRRAAGDVLAELERVKLKTI